MDINNGDISGGDRAILSYSWLTEEGEEKFIAAADINGDGDISNGDRAYLSINWLREVGDSDLFYPVPKAADTVFA